MNVEVSESTTPTGVNGKVLRNFKANLQSKPTIVALPQPLLVRPGFFYTICITKFPDDHCFYSKEFKSVVIFESGIQITFCNDKSVKKMLVGLISVLNFNKI